MGSLIDTIMASKTGLFLSRAGETISLSPNGGAAKDIEAIVRRETRQIASSSGDITYEEMLVEVKTTFADGSAYTAKEFGEDGNSGDVLTIDTEPWYLAQIQDGRKGYAGMYSLRLKSKRVADPSEG